MFVCLVVVVVWLVGAVVVCCCFSKCVCVFLSLGLFIVLLCVVFCWV